MQKFYSPADKLYYPNHAGRGAVHTRLAWLQHIQNYIHVKASKQHEFLSCCSFATVDYERTCKSPCTKPTRCTYHGVFQMYGIVHDHRQGTNVLVLPAAKPNTLIGIASSTLAR